MSAREPVMLSWTNQEEDREDVYHRLIDAVQRLQSMDPDARELYHVV